MDDPTKKASGWEATGAAKGWKTPWLALGVGVGAAIGVATGELPWGVGTGAAVGLGLQLWFGRLKR